MAVRRIVSSRRGVKKAWAGSRPLELLETRQLLAQVFTVVNTLDTTDPGSLRWAIGQVNADGSDTAASPDQIQFAIPTSDPGHSAPTGVWTIAPASALPAIARPVVLDAYTQPGASPNTLAQGDDASILIQLAGTNVPSADGLVIAGGNSVVRGLAVSGFTNGIDLTTAGNDAITGNFIGLNASGTTKAGNSNDGINILSVGLNTIGGTTPGLRNIISGNGPVDPGETHGAGIYANGSAADVVQGNYIGTDRSGTIAIGNTSNGIQLYGSPDGTIGGSNVGAGNLISGNAIVSGNGVDLGISGEFGLPTIGIPSPGVLVQGNLIGTDVTGSKPLSNGGGLAFSTRDVILDNVVSGNGHLDILVTGDSNIIQGNRVGTDITGMIAVSHPDMFGRFGSFIVEGGKNTIGGSATGSGNLISGSFGNGLVLLVDAPGANLIEGNRIGTDITGTKALPNSGYGIYDLEQSSNVFLDNLISGNRADGIRLAGFTASYNAIRNNLIGTDITGTKPLGNGLNGITVQDFQNTVGGTASTANVIAFNGGAGVGIVTQSGNMPNAAGNAVLFNSIHDNGALGIDLGGDGVTPNTPGGPHVGANDLQNYPVLTAADASAVITTIVGTLNSTPDAVFTVQFFGNPTADPSGHGQGQTYLGQLTDVTTDASGNAGFRFQAPGDLAGQFLTATATDAGGNTSEFAADLQAVRVATATTTAVVGVPNPATFGQQVTFTATVTPVAPGGNAGGTVTFTVDGVTQPPVTLFPILDGNFSQAFLTTTSLVAGTHQVSARYDGNANFAPSAAPAITQTVDPGATATTLVVRPNPAIAGGAVTLVATVSGVATSGTVTFLDGATTLGQVATGSDGRATFVTSALGVGTHALSARFEGSANASASSSGAVAEVVNPAPPVGDGPKVVSLVRFGYHWTNTRFVLTFDEKLDVARAQDPANYRLVGPDGRAIAVIPVLTGGGTIVTLYPGRYLDVHKRFVLTVNGTTPTGVANTSGQLLDGAGDGMPGSDFVAPITVRNLVGPTPLPRGPVLAKKAARVAVAASHRVARPAAGARRPVR